MLNRILRGLHIDVFFSVIFQIWEANVHLSGVDFRKNIFLKHQFLNVLVIFKKIFVFLKNMVLKKYGLIRTAKNRGGVLKWNISNLSKISAPIGARSLHP